METIKIEKLSISPLSYKIFRKVLDENQRLEDIVRKARNWEDVLAGVRSWVMDEIKDRPWVIQFFESENAKKSILDKLSWKDYASIRLLDYIKFSGGKFEDLNIPQKKSESYPFKLIWLAYHKGAGGAKPAFFEDILHLFRQFTGKSIRTLPGKKKVKEWMERHPSGLDPRIIRIRDRNRNRIIKIIIDMLDSGTLKSRKFTFDPGLTRKEKIKLVNKWWNDGRFHLAFAIRTPELLNKMLDHSLQSETLDTLKKATKNGIPFFVNPYYLSLLNVRVPEFAVGADLAIKDYIFHSSYLVREFGKIIAWEKEDIVEPGEPNAAGWILPNRHNIHRRYPETAIIIPETMARTCGGLCSSCQRMYDFQRGHLTFKHEDLKPGQKYAEIKRVRLGTRLPVYLPQRFTPDLIRILARFKEKASNIGITQFVIQTHIESAMEITPETRAAIRKLISAGWMVTNQLVLTAAASRRGHTAKLRQVLNEIGVLPYYTFTVKGFMENYHNFPTNARTVQELTEEKIIGKIPRESMEKIRTLPKVAKEMEQQLKTIQKQHDLPFLATDRNVMNLPGVGKSMTFRVIGITQWGRRILHFEHDRKRNHSPIIHKMGKVIIIESKPIKHYLDQLGEMGENVSEYEGIYGYSLGMTEQIMPIYEYPEYDYQVTPEFTNLDI